jgi:DNA-binding LytR/AlgR family response regulator
MEQNSSLLEKKLESVSHPGEKNIVFSNTSSKVAKVGAGLIRFEEKKEIYAWARPEEILFVKSADHYVKSLIQHGTQKKWMTRHCTIKDLLTILTYGHFVRLNKFYMINRNHFSHIDENEKILYLDDGFSIPISHRISRFIIDMLKD